MPRSSETAPRSRLLDDLVSWAHGPRDSGGLHAWRHQLHQLRHGHGDTLDDPTRENIAALLRVSAMLIQLIEEVDQSTGEIRDYTRARLLSSGSDLAGSAQEWMKGEVESIRDVVGDAAAFLLNWKSNTVWVEVGEKAADAALQGHRAGLEDELWELARLRRAPLKTRTEESSERETGERIGRVVDACFNPVLARPAALEALCNLYLAVLIARLAPLNLRGD